MASDLVLQCQKVVSSSSIRFFTGLAAAAELQAIISHFDLSIFFPSLTIRNKVLLSLSITNELFGVPFCVASMLPIVMGNI